MLMPDEAVAEVLSSSRATRALLSDISPGDVILIGGLARSGKSTLAAMIATRLEARRMPASIISIDRWIVPAADRSKPGVENRYDLAMMRDTLRPWLQTRQTVRLQLPSYNRLDRTRVKNAGTLDLDGDAVLVLEGVVALLASIETAGRKVHRVYVKADEIARRGRVISDLIARGVAEAEQARRMYEERELDESPVIQSSQATADYVVWSDPQGLAR
jgi:uridine kinase